MVWLSSKIIDNDHELKGINAMKFSIHLLIMLLALFTVFVPAGSVASSTDSQAEPAQTNPEAGQGTQTDQVQADAEGSPELFLPERSYRFYNVVDGQTVTHDFIIQNRGAVRLHITRVKTG